MTKSSAPELEARKYRFSYRLFLKEDRKGGSASQRTTKLSEGDSVTLEEVEVSMKDAVERIIDDIKPFSGIDEVRKRE